MIVNTCISMFIIVSLCDANSFLCQLFDERTKLLEMYGASFKGIVPFENCVDEIEPIELSHVKQLKIAGCDCDIVTFAIDKLKYVRTLDISYSYGYESLDWLDLKLDWLRKFNASHIELSAIPERFFANTPRLIEVDFSHNKLHRIDTNTFAGANKLIKMNLSHNQIWIIRFGAFDRLIDLENVDLSSNSIKSLEFFAANKKLQVIHIEENPISEFHCMRSVSLFMSWKNIHTFYGFMEFRIDQSNKYEGVLPTPDGKYEIYCSEGSFENLEYFVAGHNKFEQVVNILLCFGSNLIKIDISGNVASNLNANTLQRFDHLKELDLSGTMLPFFDFGVIKSPSKMQKLDISFNNLVHVFGVQLLEKFSNLNSFNAEGNHLDNALELIHYLRPSIEVLDLSGNLIERLNAITFAHLPALKILKLSNTMLSIPNSNPFESLANLIHLDVSHNNLKSVHFAALKTTLSKLSNLNIAYCQIDNVSEVVQQLGAPLKALDLSGNTVGPLNARTFQPIRHLEYLNLSDTTLSVSHNNPLENMKSLRFLDISHNNLEKMNFTIISSTLNQLFALTAAYNQITNVSTVTQYLGSSLVKLDLSGNPIETLNAQTLKHLTNLMHLDLSDANFVIFDIDVLKHQTNLIEIHISNNKLRDVQVRSSKQYLPVIDLHGNELTNIDNLLEQQPNIQYLGVSNNQFSCGYLSELMRKWTNLRFIDNPWLQKYGRIVIEPGASC